MLDLSIIIVSYNTKEFLLKCLYSIQENVGKINYEVIVVDNASPDSTPKGVRESGILKDKRFKLIANKENLGFSKANNIGIKNSQKSRYVLFLNPDTTVGKNSIEGMISFMNKNALAGAATCRVILPNGEIDDASHRGFPTPWNAFCHFSGLSKIFPKSAFFNGYHLGSLDLKKTHEIDVLAGAFMMTRREAGEGIGWWDEDYFFYGEDVDFCYMLKKKGWKIYYVSDISVFHHKGVSGGIRKESQSITTANYETRKRVTEWRFKAMKIFYKKHYMDKYPKLITSLVFVVIDLKLWYTLRRL